MLDPTCSTDEAAERLGIRVATLYDWLSQSDAGTFVIRGQAVTIEYFQGGRRGQGRIRISHQELRRLRELMRVKPTEKVNRKKRRPKRGLRHMTSTLGRPDD